MKGMKSTKCMGNKDSWFIYQLKNVIEYYWLRITRPLTKEEISQWSEYDGRFPRNIERDRRIDK